MEQAVILRGRTPYKLEYSIGFINNNLASYLNPYDTLYANPFEMKSTIVDVDLKRMAIKYKTRRILREYRFYYNYKSIPVVIFEDLRL